MRRILIALLALLLLFPAVAHADSPTYQTVAWGETLYSIARQYGITPQALADANNLTVNSWVYAGQTLRVPVSGTSPSAPSSPQTTPSGMYTVRAGDTLTGIARQFGVSTEALASANDIPPNGLVYTGWRLKIPGKTGTTTGVADAKTSSAYIVQPGDTLFSIALHYGVTTQAIALANGLSSTLLVYTDQRLVIPNTSKGTTNAPAPAPAASSSALNVSVSGIPLYRQQQTLTCEETAAAMALRAALSEAQIVKAMPRSDNPFAGIRGSTNYPIYGGLTNYGTYAQGLQKGLAALGRGSTVLYGQAYADFKNTVIANLKAGKAVIWWTSWRQTYQTPRSVNTSGGAVRLVPYEHTVVIVGATDWGVRYLDPYDGTTRSTSWGDFQRTSGYFGNMALIVQ